MTQALRDLEAQLRDLNIKLSEAKQKEKQAALAAFKQQVELYGITQQEVLSALGYIVQRKRKAPAKYYDPTTGRSWSGRGPKPKGLHQFLQVFLLDLADRPVQSCYVNSIKLKNPARRRQNSRSRCTRMHAASGSDSSHPHTPLAARDTSGCHARRIGRAGLEEKPD